MTQASTASLTAQLQLAEELRLGRSTMLEPQDLPGRFGRVVEGIDRVLAASHCEAVVGGGWAVWRHGYVGRVTQDIDIILPADKIDEFLRVASVSGFVPFEKQSGRWPKLTHQETGIEVDILPEGERPGTPSRPAATLIPHPNKLGAAGHLLRYVDLPGLIELKLAAGRSQDEADVVQLIAANRNRVDDLRGHLAEAHASLVAALDHLVARADEERGR